MPRLLMRGRRVGIGVDLNKDDVRRIGLVRDDVETQHARLGQGCPRVGERGRKEVLDSLRPDAHMNVNDKHAPILLHAGMASLSFR